MGGIRTSGKRFGRRVFISTLLNKSPNRKVFTALSAAAGAVALFGLSDPSAWADTYSFNYNTQGMPISGNLSTNLAAAANWYDLTTSVNGAALPGAADIAQFDSTFANLNPVDPSTGYPDTPSIAFTLSSAQVTNWGSLNISNPSINPIYIANGATAAFVLSLTGVNSAGLGIGSGGITLAGTDTALNVPVTLAAAQSWNIQNVVTSINGMAINSMALAVNANLSLGGQGASALTITGIGNVALSGAITDGGAPSGLTMNGSGILTLGGNDNYTGGTTIGSGGTIVASSLNQLIGGAGGTHAVINNGTLQLNLSSPFTYSGNLAGEGNLTVGGSTLDINGPVTATGLGVTNNAILTLDYSANTTPILPAPVVTPTTGTSASITGASLNLSGGTLTITPGIASPLTTFAATNILAGPNVINGSMSAPINLGYVNYTTTGAVTFSGTGNTVTTTQIISNTTINRSIGSYGATVEFNGANNGTVGPFQVYDNAGTLPYLTAGEVINLAASGTSGTPLPTGDIGNSVYDSTANTTTVNITASAYTGFLSGYATYGLNDWALVGPATNGTAYILPGSAYPGFYTPVGTIGGKFLSPDLMVIGQTSHPPLNLDVVGSGTINIPSNEVVTTVRFNSPNGGLTNFGGNNVDQFLVVNGYETPNFLETPNVGSSPLLIGNFNQASASSSSINTQSMIIGSGNQDAVIWQNNTLGLLAFSSGFANSNSGKGGITTAGQGTIAFDAISTYTGPTTVNGTTIQIPFSRALGDSSATNTLTLNGGQLIATGSFSLDNEPFTANTRNIIVSSQGGNISAIGQNSLTVDGVISGPGDVTFGQPNSALFGIAVANTQNAVVNFRTSSGTGIVHLTGANTYTGTSTVAGGTLIADGSFASTNFIINTPALGGAVLSGVPILPSNSSVTVNTGGTLFAGDAGAGAFTAGSVTLNTGSSLAFAFNSTSANRALNPIVALSGLNNGASGSPNTVNLSVFQQNSIASFFTSGSYVLMQVPTSSNLVSEINALVPGNNNTLSFTTANSMGTQDFTTNNVAGFLLSANTLNGDLPGGAEASATYALTTVGAGTFNGINVSDIVLDIASKVFGATWAGIGGGSWVQNPNNPANYPHGATGPVNWSGPAVTNSTFTPPIPNGDADSAAFGPSITAPSTVTVDATVTVGNISFNSSNAYTIATGATGSGILMSNESGPGGIAVVLGKHTISAPITLVDGVSVLIANPTDTLTIKGGISGNGGLSVVGNGAGTLILSGNISNTYVGATSIVSSTGTIQVGDGATFGTLDKNGMPFANSGTLVFDQPSGSTTTFASNMSGPGGLSQIGAGSTLVLTGSNSFQGTTIVAPGTKIQIGSAAATNLPGLVQNNGLIDVNGQNLNTGSLDGAGTYDNVSAGGLVTLQVGTANTNSTWAGIIKNTTGTVALLKSGAGNLLFTGTNSFLGDLTIAPSGGAVTFSSSTNIPSSVTIHDANPLQANNIILLNGVDLKNNIDINAFGDVNETFEVPDNMSAEIDGNVSLSAGAQLRIGFENTLGTLTFGGNSIANAGSGFDFITDGNIIYTGNSENLSSKGIGISLHPNEPLNLTVEGNAALVANGNSGFNIGKSNNPPFVNLTVAGHGFLDTGSGNFELEATNSVNEVVTVNLNGGAIRAGNFTCSPSFGTAATASLIVNFNGGAIISGGNSANFLPTNATPIIRYQIGDGGALFDTNGFVSVVQSPAGFISNGDTNGPKAYGITVDGGLTKVGAGHLDFTENAGTNSFTGAINAYGGLLEFASDGQYKSAAYIQTLAGGAVGLQTGTLGNPLFTQLVASAPLNLVNGIPTTPQSGSLAISQLDQNTNIDFRPSSQSGIQSQNGTFTYFMANEAVSNSNAPNGSASLANMSIGAVSGLGANGLGLESSAVSYNASIKPGFSSATGFRTYQLGGGGTLQLVSVTVGANAPGGGPLGNGDGTPLVDFGGTTNNVLIENGGAVLLSTTNTYSGTTTIQGVVVNALPAANANTDFPVPTTNLEQTALEVSFLGDPTTSGTLTSSNSSIGSSSVSNPANLVLNGGILQYVGSGVTSNRLFTIGTLGATLDSSGAGTAGLTMASTGNEAFSSSVGATSLTLQGTFGQLTGPGTGTLLNTLSGHLTDPSISASLSLIKSGSGAWSITNSSNSFTGGTTVNAGVLQVGAAGALGSTLGGLTVNAGGTLDLDGFSLGAGALSGGGIIDNITAGGSPILTIGNGNASGAFSGSITNTTGAVSLVHNGTGTLTLTGANTYSGMTTVNAGALVIGAAGALPSAATVVNNGALVINANSTVTQITGNTGALTVGSATAPAVLRLAFTSGKTLGPASAVGSLTINAGSQLNITNHDLVINYQAAGADPVAAIRADLTAAYKAIYAGSTLALTSSTAAASPSLFAVGYVDNTSTHQLTVGFTVPGDTDLSGSTDFNDLTTVAQFFGQSVAKGNNVSWSTGDVNYDNQVDFNDLTLVAQYFGQSLTKSQATELPASFVAQYDLALAEVQAAGGGESSVPEPGMVSLLVVGAAGLLARRRRRGV